MQSRQLIGRQVKVMTEKEFFDALINRQGEEKTRRFREAKVAICGLGGMGSLVALSLARAGVGELKLMDFDEVTLSNIHRQQYRLSQVGKAKTEAVAELVNEVNPFCRVVTENGRITEENVEAVLKGYDMVCEDFDNPQAKAMLTNEVLTRFPEKTLVACSGMAGFGEANRIRTKQIAKRFYLCGDGTSDVKEAGSLVAPRVTVCAGHQALMVLQLLAGETD